MTRRPLFGLRLLPVLGFLCLAVGQAVAAAQEAPREDERRVFVWRNADEQVVELTPGPGRRGFLGVDLLDLTPELRAHFGVPEDRGILISRVHDDSPARRAGLAVGDVVTAVDGRPLPASIHLAMAVARAAEDEPLSLECWRDRRRLTLRVPIEIRQRSQFDISPLVRRQISIDAPHRIEIHSDHDGDEAEAEWIEDVVFRVGESLTQSSFQQQLEAMRLERTRLLDQLGRMEERLQRLEEELDRLSDD